MSDLAQALLDALDDEALDQLAQRLAPRLAALTPAPARFVDAATLAAELGVSRDTIYARAAELGGVKIGDGPRPRWRFDLDKAREAWSGWSVSGRSQDPSSPAGRAVSRRRRRAGKGSGAPLLPIRGGSDAS